MSLVASAVPIDNVRLSARCVCNASAITRLVEVPDGASGIEICAHVMRANSVGAAARSNKNPTGPLVLTLAVYA